MTRALALVLLLASLAGAQEEQKPETQERPGFLGVSTEPFPLEGSDPPRAVIRVTAVVPGSAAADALLEIGDVILAVDGSSIADEPGKVAQTFGAAIRAKPAGAKVVLLVRRPTVEVRTFFDEKLAETRQASGARASRRILPDLAALLEERSGELVGVRARRYTRERDVQLTLGERPGSRSLPLPLNDALRPRLNALALDPPGQLASKVLQRARHENVPLSKTYAELLERFERDEGREDPYRLKTVRYLHRAPLRLSLATRALGVALRRTFRRGAREGQTAGLDALLSTARFHLDGIAAVDTETAPREPARGASPNDHALYIKACVQLAERRVERGLAALSTDERAFLRTTLPGLAEQFAKDIYLHADEDPERWKRHARAIDLLSKVDRSALIAALEALTNLADIGYLAQLRRDLRAAEREGASAIPSGGIRGKVLWFSDKDHFPMVIGSSEDNEYRRDLRVAIDLGGDDRYHAGVGAGVPGHPAAVCIDLSGDDRYQSTQPFTQGAGFLGVGLLLDVSGNDHYTSSQPFAQGAALAGAALLVDAAGDDTFRGTTYAQGAALLQGLAGLVDLGGDDLVSAGLYAQGFAGPGSFGALLARGGNDRYAALAGAPCSYGDVGTYRGMSQGASIGFRHRASGGIAVLLDDGGRDLYEAGNFSQGGGYYYGWGSLIDLGGSADRYEGSRYSQAFSAHSALGSLWEDGGNDIYRGWVGAQNSAAWDLSVTSFLDERGDDRYETGPGFSVGASAHNGFSLFVDGDGADTYRVAPGRAGPNEYHGGPSISVFIDAGGDADTYRGGGLENDRVGTESETAVLLDLAPSLEDVDDSLLDRLFQ